MEQTVADAGGIESALRAYDGCSSNYSVQHSAVELLSCVCFGYDDAAVARKWRAVNAGAIERVTAMLLKASPVMAIENSRSMRRVLTFDPLSPLMLTGAFFGTLSTLCNAYAGDVAARKEKVA